MFNHMTDCKSALLLESAVALLKDCDDPDRITTRMISDRAGVNLALINYYYGSKDELLKAAAGEIMGRSSADLYGFASDDDPKDAVIGFFTSISRDMIRYRKYTSLFLPDLVMKGRIEHPDFILPAVRRFFDGSRTEQECRMAAYRIVMQAQVIFYRMDDVSAYTGTDLSAEGAVDDLIRTIVDDTLRRD